MATVVVSIEEATRTIIRDSVQFDETGRKAKIVRQLERDSYVKVDKAFKALGGKWNRKEAAHIFNRDARAELFGSADAGRMVVDKVIDKKVLWQQFYTPEAVAKKIIDLAEIEPGMKVLEPEAGQGALAIPAREAGGEVVCCEIDPENCALLEAAGFKVIHGDFMTKVPPHTVRIGAALHVETPSLDRVCMNPPFTRGQDVDHVLHALRFLEPGGRLVTIMSKGVTFRATKKYEDFYETLSKCRSYEIHDLPEYSFEESGTKVNTVVVVIDK